MRVPGSGSPDIPAMPDPMDQAGGISVPGDMVAPEGPEGMPTDSGMDMTQGFQADENLYDADFDAGVEADEETDPKRFIQQLTGKLSQSLRKYNEGLPQPDADLNKYVSGMVVKQCLEGLSPEDVKDIMDKVKSDETVEDNRPEEEPAGNEEAEEPMQMNESESVRQSVSNQYNSLTKNDRYNDDETVPDRNAYHKRPFVGKTFKN